MSGSGIRRRAAAFCLALALTLTAAVPALAAEEPAGRGTAWSDMTYVHYDPEAFYERTDELTALAAGEDGAAVLALYDELHSELLQVWTYSSIAGIHASADVTDEYWQEEELYAERTGNETADAFCTACNVVLGGPCADAFKEHVGPEAAAYYADYVPATDREIELADREAELISQYYEILNDSASRTYSYGGVDWTEDMLYGDEGDRLYDRDQDGYWAVSDGLAKALNDRVGPVYVELVGIRAEQASIWGYDDYAEAAYESVYGRDYGPDEAQLLCDAVKRFSWEYYDGLYGSELWYMADQVYPVLSETEQMAALGQFAGRLDPTLRESWQFMTQMGLYELTDDPDSRDSGYTTSLYAYGSPFIYNRLYGNCYDLDDLSHEFGHFTDEYLNPAPDPIVSTGSYDLFEIHSTGLEALFSQFYDEVYSDGADTARFLVLGGLLESVINGCIYDEFQRRVYAQPDMTLDEINAAFAQVCREYGMGPGQEYAWQTVSHNFDSPLYYISYAVSSLASLQIWDLSQSDYDAAVAMYMDVLGRGAYGDGYMDVLTDCGMRLFTEPGAVEDICQPVLDYMERLEWSELW